MSGYERTWTVRFSDTDPFGIAHYPRIIDAVHETSDMFMEEIGFPFWALTQEHGYGLPLVHMDFDFEHPMNAGDDVVIEVTPSVGTKSVRLDYEATCDGVVTFSGYEQRVCATHGGEGAIEVPDDFRAALDAYAADSSE
ncbi:4-hydroxybenzoyl-CoA thioesterase family active site [Halarchaeum acidiphilum MH1-52-1]|uniref:4-hydroxybenzoyl-CoA thioesterase family active site n=1 Tax=Halarchaeum acidiphilum MH1-52-1 TaxID=1261545 RepID=U3A6Z7_9EURY|nr:thioesterase family protein [Halarchaeum acidiphilum]GAD53429.1 4-hydroxybenzoyl-CoA thioesterase family active site [Halarchaeum acidiphilum MH1-52-1]